MEKNTNKSHTYQVELTEMTYRWLQAMADKYKVSVEQMANEAILEYFSDDIDDARHQ